MKKFFYSLRFVFLLFLCSQLAWAQQTIKGKITSETKEPLPGVSVVVKGTTTGASSDANGNYTIQTADGNATLVFSFIGYTTEEVAVGGRTTIDIEMVPDITSLSEVVVTALGISKDRKQLGYSVTEVKGSDFTQAREVNLGNALSGKIAGVNATSTATGPGGSSRVIIRGNGSLNGATQPLYVINGVPIDNTNSGSAGEWGGFDRGDGLSSINPDDIESISVLKGGTAAALYGSRAANGVIVITTKSGKGQKGIGVELNSTYTLEKPLTYTDWQYEYGSGTRGNKPTTQQEAIAAGLSSWGTKLDGSSVIQFDGVSRPYSAQKNNVKNFYDNGGTFTNTVAVSGGNEGANFRFSASNLDAKNMVPNSSIDRKTFNLSTNATLAKKIVFSGMLQYNIESAKNRTFLSDSPKNPNYSTQLLATNVDVRSLNPGYDERGYEVLFNSNVYATNPYFAINKVQNSDSRNRLLGQFSLRYNITDFLYIRGRLGTDYSSTKATDIEPTGLAYRTVGAMSITQGRIYENNAELLVGFNKQFDKFSVDAILGGNQMRRVDESMRGGGNTFNVPFNYFLDNLVNRDNTGISYSKVGINSLFGSADFGYNNYLFLNATARQDWFSTLSPQNNSLFYPSVGASFVFSEAFSVPTWLSYGKVRGSWAQVGGGYPSAYALNLTYSQPGVHLGQSLMNIGTNTIPNPNLKPYTSTTSEIGLELKTLNNRLGLDLALYNRITTNDQVQASTSSASGYRNVLINVGEVRNKGIEVLLTGTPVKSESGFIWDVSYNFAYNKNTIVKISDQVNTLYLGQARTQNAYVYNDQGQPFGIIKGYAEKRDEQGRIVYNSATGLPLQSDLMILGKGVPPLTMGITNSFSYKNFTLSFLVDGKFGGQMYSASNAYATLMGLQKMTLEGRETGVTVSGVDQNGNEFTKTVDAQTYYQGLFSISEKFVYDADFIKLRQFTLGYSLPKSLLAKTPFQSASLSLVGRNLLLLYSKVPNVDPESSYNSGAAQGLEMFGVPPARSFGLNLMLKF